MVGRVAKRLGFYATRREFDLAIQNIFTKIYGHNIQTVIPSLSACTMYVCTMTIIVSCIHDRYRRNGEEGQRFKKNHS